LSGKDVPQTQQRTPTHSRASMHLYNVTPYLFIGSLTRLNLKQGLSADWQGTLKTVCRPLLETIMRDHHAETAVRGGQALAKRCG
jgi:hypothetical protein